MNSDEILSWETFEHVFVLPNTALQPTGYSGLRPLPPSAKLERYVTEELDSGGCDG
jgi:hypothetical protein